MEYDEIVNCELYFYEGKSVKLKVRNTIKEMTPSTICVRMYILIVTRLDIHINFLRGR